jgi:hypothetical protein
VNALKAIIVGCVFILITILTLQLVYIFVAVGYNALAQDYPVLNDIVGIFRYLIGIPIFIAVMFIGGYLTANIANMDAGVKAGIKVTLLCMSVALITAGGMIYPTLQGAPITTTGIVIFILSLLATVAGGLYWLKRRDGKIAR